MSPEDARQPLLTLLSNYLKAYPDESEMTARYISFVEKNADCFKRSLSIGHVTGSAFIVDNACKRVLLTHHKKLDRWLQPGGHADGDPDVAAVGLREAEEESGLEAISFYTPELLDVDIHSIPARKDEPEHFHYDCRFLLRSSGSDDFIISDESHDLAWVPFGDIFQYTNEELILRMLKKAQRTLAC
ncbi:MAG: NUDIX hydrolase [Proteobacteria bacterium]|nr:NUDIX hydrolase [Pseudomonadota bacterium]